MSEKPLNEYLDMEVYDVVSGDQYRALQEQLEAVRRERDKMLDVETGVGGRLPSQWYLAMKVRVEAAEEQLEALQIAARTACREFYENGPLYGAAMQVLDRTVNGPYPASADRNRPSTGDRVKAPSVDPPSSVWVCPHGATFSGSPDFISGARNAHDAHGDSSPAKEPSDA